MRFSKTLSTAAVALTLAFSAPGHGADAAVTKRLYLASNGRANTANGDGVLSWAPSTREVTDRYVFDPKEPVPLNSTDGSDRREVQSRKDVLVYTTAALDRPVQAVGSIAVELYAASDARDTGFTAAIEDVQTDGKVVLLGSGPIRGSRSAASSLLTPGKVVRYHIDLGAIGHAFLPGHRIRVEISSSAAPMFNPNPDTGKPIAADTDGKIANQRVFHDIAHPSNLVLRVVD